MKKVILGIVCASMLVPAIAFANGDANVTMPGWDDLTPAQQQELKLEAAKKAEAAKAAKQATPVTANDVKEWVELGKSIGIGFASTAKELGVSVDQLMHTDTGKIAMFLIVWHYIGHDFMGILGGIIWFTIMLTAWARYFRRWVLNPVVTYHENGKKKEVRYDKSKSNEGAIFYFTVALIVILIAGFILVF